MQVPDRAEIVVIGGGVIGVSVAYHLAQAGRTDVLLIEQGRLSSGTTWHAAGLVGQLRATESGTRLVQYSTDLYARLEDEVGLATGYQQCGGLVVARTRDRLIQLQRTAATAEAFDLDCEIISADEAKQRYPLLEASDLVGAIWLPGDGTVNPSDLTAALARGARMRGVQILERVRVTGIATERGRVTGVQTDLGHVETDIVVNCAGQWAKAVGEFCGVTVPLHSAEHFYVVTEQIQGVHRELPILRDPDGYTYFKQEVGGLVVGGFEPNAKPWVAPDALPYPFEFQLLDEDWDHFSILMDSAVRRIPALATTGIKKFYNGPESFTPDNQFVLGEAPEVKNFFVAAGFNSVGIASAGGAGKALAEWIIAGEPGQDLVVVDIRRFAPFNGNNRWLRERVSEVLGLHYALPWPNREFESARPFRRSPVYAQLVAANALLGSRMGWERPNVFASSGPPSTAETAPLRLNYSWGIPDWQQWCNHEQLATRRAVAVFDQTSFGKLLVAGRDAVRLLQWLCAADIDVAVGRAVYTPMLNERATYEADVTITRTGHDEFLLITSSASPVRDQDWLRRHTPDDFRVSVTDVSGSTAVFGVMGPYSRDLLSALTTADLSNEGFPFGSSREVGVGTATVRATRITYVGELGWELHVPNEFAVGVYESLLDAGAQFKVVNAGYYAINALRLEKGYRAFGTDLTPDFNPVEAGLLFATKLETDIPFLGRIALEKARSEGPARRLVSFTVHDAEIMMWGGELVTLNGRAIGQVTSAAWCASVGRAVGLAYVRHPDRLPITADYLAGPGFAVNVSGVSTPVGLSLKPPYDPSSVRVRS